MYSIQYSWSYAMTSEARLSHIELVSRGGIFLFPSCDLVKSYRHFKLVEHECIKYRDWSEIIATHFTLFLLLNQLFPENEL